MSIAFQVPSDQCQPGKHQTRFEARTGGSRQAGDGSPILYEQQDEALWDTALINKGFAFLHESLSGDELSAYHLEARIASWHCVKADTPEKWAAILTLYDQLLTINNSPSVVLNQVYALFKVRGRAAALSAAETLKLDTNHLYFTLLGELYRETDSMQATAHFQQAYALAKTSTDRQTIQQKLDQLNIIKFTSTNA